jgi:N5-(cytidine 5'-diphosphoramidyl)-L-glutamine hydrolase
MNIGITQRVDRVDSHEEWRDALDHQLIKWVFSVGFTPIPIPNILINTTSSDGSQETLDDWIDSVGIDGLLLSGGNDIGDFPHRDLTENHLLIWAEKNRKPVLGICRGMQMMGVYFGGKLIEVYGHIKTYHKLQATDNFISLFSDLVNSYHNFSLQECPNSFQVLAKSEDGCIEAMMHKDLPWEAWMWHPEREEKFVATDQVRFERLMKYGK